MSPKVHSRPSLAPDKAPLTESQATVLGSLTGIEASKLKGLSIAEISAEFRWQIDPHLLLFTQICGQVVKKDPATGNLDPVPYATVQVEETVCSLLGFFPISNPWTWFFPFHCTTDVVATVTTDPCGNFCVWVPSFMVEWILRFRRERVCYLELFNKPTVANVIAYLQGNPIGPDPGPEAQANLVLKSGTPLYQKAEQLLGSQVVRQLAAASTGNAVGSSNASQAALLARPAFSTALAPALPKEFRTPPSATSREEFHGAVRSTLANNLGLEVNHLERLDLNRYFGPFLRCYNLLVPEWVQIAEVPDISFTVTQVVNGPGTTPVVIYSSGLFDVPWGSGIPSNVTLLASPIAISTTNCNTPAVPCGTVPSLEYVGLMPLVNPTSPPGAQPYIDPVAGFATRPNPPHPAIPAHFPFPAIPGGTLGGPSVPPSTAPYCGTLQIYGCTEVDSASYYRLRYTYTAPGSATPSALTPFTGLTWPLYLEVGGNLEEQWPVSDASGWYPVINPSIGWFPGNMVLEWETNAYPDGLYTVQLEVADGSKNLLATSTPVGFRIDNSVPKITYSAVWSFNSGFSPSTPVPINDCVVIDRGVIPQDVYIQLTYSVVANHLQSVEVISGGCDGGATQTSPTSTAQHWYEDAGDNSVSNVVTYVIPAATAPQGVYSFEVWAASRAFNPSGGDGGQLADWNYSPTYVWTDPSFAIAIVNA
jgi:hypothetical protein